MAPLTTYTRLAPRAHYYYSSGYSDTYYKGRIIGIAIGISVFIILCLLAIYISHKKKKARRLALANTILPYGPGGYFVDDSGGHPPTFQGRTAPPPYTGPVGQEPKWNGTQWQGPNNMDGTKGPCWNGVQWCEKPGPVWNGVQWVAGGPVNGVNIPMSENGRVWNGTAWVGPYDAQVAGQNQGQDSGVTVPAPAYTQNDEQRRNSLRAMNVVNAHGGMGHAATQSRDFGGVVPKTTATPEVREVKDDSFKAWLKKHTGA